MTEKKDIEKEIEEKQSLILDEDAINEKLEAMKKQILEEQQTLKKEIKILKKKKKKAPEVICESEEFEKQSFVDSRFTIEDALELIGDNTIRFKKSYMNLLASCIALTKKGEFIIKERGEEMIEFRLIEKKSLIERFNFEIEYIVSEEEKLKQKRNKKAIKDYSTINLFELLREKEFRVQCLSFADVVPHGNDKEIFSLWRPAVKELYLNENIIYKPEIAQRFLKFVSSRVQNPFAFWDLINTMVYQMKNPGKKAFRFYICYDFGGMAYKTYSIENLVRIYGRYAFMNIDPETMKDKFNEWQLYSLFHNFEEGENSIYVDKDVERYVKRCTSKETSIRAMRETTKQGKV